MAIQVPNVAELPQLDVIRDLITAAEIKLFKNNLTISATTVLADFTEANYSGYGGGQTPAWTAVATDGSGRAHTTSDVMTWSHSGGGTSNTIYGYYCESPTDGLLFAEKFATAIVMDDATDVFNLQIDYRLREDS